MMTLSRLIKSALIATSLSLTAFSTSALAEKNHLVIAESKGDRGMPAPYLHHKNGPGYLYSSYIFDTLVGQDKQGKPAPNLATAWRVSVNGLVYDLQLNTKAVWHDGRAFSADDVVFTFEYMHKHPYKFVSLKNIAEVKAVAPDQIQIRLKKPDAGMVNSQLMAMPILPQHIYSTIKAPAQFVDPQAAIGTGPYRLSSYDKAQGRYKLARHENYHLGKPKYQALAITKMAPVAAIKAIAAGKVSLFNRLPLEKEALAKQSGLSVFKYHSNHPSRLKFNHKGLFKAVSMRHALAYAIDRQALRDTVYAGGKGVVANTGFFQKDSVWRAKKEDKAYTYNPNQAAKLLEHNGWQRDANGQWLNDGKPVELRFIVHKSFKKLATTLAEQLQNFGIQTNLRIVEKAALHDHFRTGEFDISIITSSTLGDPNHIATRIFSKSPKSDLYKGNGQIKKLLAQQATAKTPEERAQILQQFQDLYAQKLPSYMLINPIWAVAHQKEVKPLHMKTGVAFGIPMVIPKNILMP